MIVYSTDREGQETGFCPFLVILLFCLLFVFSRASTACTQGKYSDEAKYNNVFQVACHNCFEEKHSPSLTEALNGSDNQKPTRILEIDFFDYKNWEFGAEEKSWYVRHAPGWPLSTGNSNNCTGDGYLKDCLQDLIGWSRNNPGHDVITVYLDKKQPWNKTRMPEDLDELLTSVIGEESIFKPVDLLSGKYVSLRHAARNEAWPSMKELKNKFIFVMTGRSDKLNNYIKSRGHNAVIFVASDTTRKEDIIDIPKGFNKDTAKHIVFYNIKSGKENLGTLIHKNHFVSRVWGGDKKPLCSFVNKCINAPAYYKWDQICEGGDKGIIVEEKH